MKTSLSAALLALAVVRFANGQQAAPMSVSLDFENCPDAGKKAIEKYVSNGLDTRGIHNISDNGLDPRQRMFDDYAWVVIKPVGDAGSSSYALEIQLSIAEGASVNNMLLRFRGSLASGIPVSAGATEQEVNAALLKLLFGMLDKLMDEAKLEFGSPAYRHGWHPIPVPHRAG